MTESLVLPSSASRRWRASCIMGWVAVGISTILTCVWTYWGITENFYEGWYYPALLPNMLLMFNYLMWMLIFLALSLISIRWSRIGGILYGVAGIYAAVLYDLRPAPIVFFVIPLGILGMLYWFSCIQSRKWAYLLAVGLPVMTLVLAGTEPVLRVTGRVFDGNLEARLVEGNNVSLIWAPAGLGWPRQGSDWHGAVRTCRHLTSDGKSLAPTAQDVWRLPSVDEVVRSLTRHGENVGGTWNAESGQVSYSVMPDKESPLWDIYSPVIYWWTNTEIDGQRAYMVSFSGLVLARPKTAFPDYYAFRCIKNP